MSSSTDLHISMAETGHRNEKYEYRSYLNALTPIGKLPPELMAQIFLIVVQSQYESQYDHRKSSLLWYSVRVQSISNSWLSIACVCWQWRETAIQTASLWTVVKPTHLEWTKLLLERSKSFPLTLVVPEGLRINHDAYALALQHANRFSSVDMELVVSSAGPLEQQTLPFLQHIVFTSPSDEQPMPDIFDRCHLPALTSLELDYYRVTPSSPMFARTLTHLSIAGATGLTVPVAVEILSKTPALVNLVLHTHDNLDLSFDTPPPFVAEIPRISLPCLERCSLALFGNDLIETVTLLNQLNLPSSATLNVATLPPSDDFAELFGQGLVPTLAGDNRIGPMPKYHSCLIDFSRILLHLSREVHSAWNETMIGRNDDDNDDICSTLFTTSNGFTLWIPPDVSDTLPIYSISCLFEVLRHSPLVIEGVESLTINYEQYKGHTPGWHTVSSRMPKLSQLQINLRDHDRVYSVRSSFWRFLVNMLLLLDGHEGKSEDEDEGEAEVREVNSAEPVLPRLKTFALSKRVLRPPLVNSLLDVLGTRKARGAVIDTLVIRGHMKGRAKYLERLQRFVEDVIWVKY